MFENLTDQLNEVFTQLRRRGKLSEADVDTAMRQVRLALLEADVNYGVAKDFVARVRERAIGHEVSKALNPGQMVVKIVNEELIATLGEPDRLNLSGARPPRTHAGRFTRLREDDCIRETGAHPAESGRAGNAGCS